MADSPKRESRQQRRSKERARRKQEELDRHADAARVSLQTLRRMYGGPDDTLLPVPPGAGRTRRKPRRT